jgi:hypothetical protein
LKTARNRLVAASRWSRPTPACRQNQANGDDDIHHRAGDGDQQLLPGLVRHPVHIGDAADRQQRHFRRHNAELSRREDMPEFMQHDAGEDRRNEQNALSGGFRAALLPGAQANPGEEQQQGHMNADRSAFETANGEGPAHDDFQQEDQYLSEIGALCPRRQLWTPKTKSRPAR